MQEEGQTQPEETAEGQEPDRVSVLERELQDAIDRRKNEKAKRTELEARIAEYEQRDQQAAEQKAIEAGDFEAARKADKERIEALEGKISEYEGAIAKAEAEQRNKTVEEALTAGLSEVEAKKARAVIRGLRADGSLEDGAEDTDAQIKEGRRHLKELGFGSETTPGATRSPVIPSAADEDASWASLRKKQDEVRAAAGLGPLV